MMAVLIPAAAAAITAVQLAPCHVAGVAEVLKCGVHQVYENRETMRGRKLPLGIIVIAARHPSPGEGPIFYLTGGPGETDASANGTYGLAGAACRLSPSFDARNHRARSRRPGDGAARQDRPRGLPTGLMERFIR